MFERINIAPAIEAIPPGNLSLEALLAPAINPHAEIAALPVIAEEVAVRGMLTGAEARLAQFANMTAQVPQPKGIFFVK